MIRWLKNNKISGLLFLAVVLMAVPFLTLAQNKDPMGLEAVEPAITQPEKFYVAKILDIVEKESEVAEGYFQKIRLVTVEIVKGERKGEKLTVEESLQSSNNVPLQTGDKVIVGQFQSLDDTIYYVADYYRVTPIVIVVALFFAFAIFFGRWKGLTSILGLVFTILILGYIMVPQILSGADPVIVTLLGGFLIAVVSIFLAHGVSRRTALALISTLITLSLATLFAFLSVNAARLLGLGSEEAMLLQALPTVDVNMKGLLLSAIIIGTLGILDDVTTSQTAAVDEISKANSSLKFRDLYKRGLSVGHEHIAALINTLVLAYAGASLPLFLLFSLNNNVPFWVILNGELVAEEVIRTVVGSTALILAVPISTFLAAYYLPRWRKTEADLTDATKLH